MKVVTNEVRFSYCHIWEATSMDPGATPKYSVTLLIPKSDTKTVAKINEAIEAAKEEGKGKWGGKIPPNMKSPLRDGDIERPDRPEYEGMYFIGTSSVKPVKVVDENINAVEPGDDDKLFSGAYGRASINLYPYAKSANKGVAAGLLSLMVNTKKDGERLSGTSSNPFVDFGDGFLD
jgi:hypothetical protein